MRFVVVLLLLAACVDTGPGPQPRVDPKYARAHLLKEPPADLDRFDVAVGDKAIYLGNKIDRPRLAPGQSLVIKHYWKVVKPIGKGWRPFALVRGPPGSSDFMNLELTDMQIAHPLSAWKAGEIIEDEQHITIRPDWTSPHAFLYVGLIEVGEHNTLDRMAVTGARTQDRAIVAAKLEIDLARAPPRPGTVHIPRASGPITIDGMQIDQAWVTAVTSPEFVTADGGSPDPSGKATAKLLWDDQYLYVFMNIIDTDIGSPYKNPDDSLWKADAIEIFIDADGNRAGYIELQVNPHNTQFDSWFAGPRGSQGDVPWQSNMVSMVKVRGTPDPGDTDIGWDVELGIPWAAVRGRDEKMAVNLPPRIGDQWKINIVRVDVKSGNSQQSASSWNKIGYGDWHALDRMLTAVFADPTGSTVAPPPGQDVPGIAPGQGVGSNVAPGAGSNISPTSGSSVAPGLGSNVAPGSAPRTGSGSNVAPSSAPRTGSGSNVAPKPGAGSSVAPKPGGVKAEGGNPPELDGTELGGSGAPRAGSATAPPTPPRSPTGGATTTTPRAPTGTAPTTGSGSAARPN
jgi:hypothetical protein